jgi:hypothetical protein
VFWTQDALPKARTDGVLAEPVGAETVVYDRQTREAHCLRPLAATVFSNADGETAPGRLAELASAELEEPVDEEEVVEALAQLEERGLLEVGFRPSGMSRRTLIRRSAVAGGAAVAAPLISSVLAPAAVAQASAGCGPLLCCPCTQGSSLGLKGCCFIEGVTLQCECAAAVGDECKKCKPSGSGPPTEAFCAANPPDLTGCANNQAAGEECNQFSSCD